MFSQFDNKKEILVVFLVLFVFMTGLGVKIKDVVQTMKKSNRPCVVIDCGHGGIDPGKVGINGVYEKKINLAIGLYVKEALEKKNIRVVMTRKKDEGLYQDSDANKKIADLNQRIAIMDREEPDCVISIHQNSFTGQNSRGAQVFYQTGSQNGEILAKILQEQLVSSLDTKNHRRAKANAAYYLLKKTVATAVIVECGFLSNAQEAERLCRKSYQRQVALAIAQGTEQYLKEKRQK